MTQKLLQYRSRGGGRTIYDILIITLNDSSLYYIGHCPVLLCPVLVVTDHELLLHALVV